MGQTVDTAEALGVRRPLLRIGNRVDAVADALDDGIVPLPEYHFFRVAKEVTHRDPEAADGLRDVALNDGSTLRPGNRLADDLPRTEGLGAAARHGLPHAPMLAVRVPPAIAANFADVLDST